MPHYVDSKTVRHVAKLARIHISDEEVGAIAHHLTKILGYVAILDELDTAGVQAAAPNVGLPNTLREDAAKSSWPSQKALDNAPDKRDGFIRVPKLLDQGET